MLRSPFSVPFTSAARRGRHRDRRGQEVQNNFLADHIIKFLSGYPVRSPKGRQKRSEQGVEGEDTQAKPYSELSSDSPSKSEPIPDGPSSRCVKRRGEIKFSPLSSQTLPDCRGPGPLQSHKLSVATDKNLIFPRQFTQRDEGQSTPGTQI